MPRANVIVEVPVQSSFRVSAMRGMYDVKPEIKLRHEWQVDLPIDNENWNIGLIVGSSGSGKTTIAKQLWNSELLHEGYEWHPNQSILDGFPKNMDIKEIIDLLCHVGFSSPPSWAKPFRVLSTGQKFRVELARVLADDKELTIIDEFTSVVDRNAAKVGSFAIAKTARKKNKKLLCLSCHRDIVEWLQPDWIYDTDSNQFHRGSVQRPKIELKIYSVDRSAWRLFREHHYLTSDIGTSAQCFVAYWNDVPIAFTSYVHSAGYFGIKRTHRTVVLPDYQGIGIGNNLVNWLCERLKKNKWRVTSVFSHPAFVHSRLKSGKWVLIKHGHQDTGRAKNSMKSMVRSSDRLTVRMEYIGS